MPSAFATASLIFVLTGDYLLLGAPLGMLPDAGSFTLEVAFDPDTPCDASCDDATLGSYPGAAAYSLDLADGGLAWDEVGAAVTVLDSTDFDRVQLVLTSPDVGDAAGETSTLSWADTTGAALESTALAPALAHLDDAEVWPATVGSVAWSVAGGGTLVRLEPTQITVPEASRTAARAVSVAVLGALGIARRTRLHRSPRRDTTSPR